MTAAGPAPSGVVTVTGNARTGTVVRWYRDLLAATHNRPTLSASRDGVMIHGQVYLHTIPAEWITDATLAYEALKAGAGDVSGYATHRRADAVGPLEPITQEAR
ncbi:hypothetical protein [Actinomadura nitritigenes]|uniref:hypothetical protein n=1 Tax=Actinomadura nitritigenes TaxID=134602 RepID=UPI003D92E3FD